MVENEHIDRLAFHPSNEILSPDAPWDLLRPAAGSHWEERESRYALDALGSGEKEVVE